jgi:hypothetical protein
MNLDFCCLVNSYRNDLLSLKTDVNVLTEGNKQSKLEEKKYFLLASWKSLTKRARSANQVYRSKDPDPYQNVTDSEHCSFQ